jgi:superfamily II DNA or RNA helicase
MLTIVPVDNVWVRIDCDDAIAHELSDYFTFDVPGAHFMPAARKGWDRKIRLFKLRTHTLYRGLVPRIIEFADAHGYEVTNQVPVPTPLWPGALLDRIISKINLPLPLRDYQYAALRFMFDHERGIIQSPTGSGKSYIMYLLVTLMEPTLCRTDAKTLIIVPTLGLVTQMVSDFKSYGYDAVRGIQTITAGQSKDIVELVTVSTWQSIYDMPLSWFDQFGCVIVDEVHLAKAKKIGGIMEKCTKTPYRFGFTGTLDNLQCHRLILEGLFGSVNRVATTNELVKKKQLTPPRVIVMVLEYPDAVKKQLRRCEYTEEIDFIAANVPRNKFLALLCREQKHNTLLLFQLVAKMGVSLFARTQQLISPAGMDSPREVWYIDGNTLANNREAIRQHFSHVTNDVLLASYGTTQLGVNIPSLRTLIFAHPSKSLIRVLQSIGRILRLDDGKAKAVIIDVVDDLRYGKWVNHTFKHAEARMAYYAAEKFPVTLRKIPLAMFAVKASGTRPDGSGTTNAAGTTIDA